MSTTFVSRVLLGLSATCFGALLVAGEADVLEVRIDQDAAGSYTFHVTVAHADTGWEHYADAWEVASSDGEVLGVRTLLHPHVEEQPFTRSLSGVRIPPDISEVIVRARDSVHGLGGSEVRVQVPR